MAQAAECQAMQCIDTVVAFESNSEQPAVEMCAGLARIFDALPATTAASLEPARQLLRWAEGRGCELAAVCVQFSQEFGCRGLFATVPIRRGEVVLSMTKATTITLQNCYSAAPELERHRVAEFSAFAYFLMQCMRQIETADAAKPCFWEPYLRCLPSLEDIGNALSKSIDERLVGLPQEYATAITAARRRAAASLQYLQETAHVLMDDEQDLYRLRYAMALIFSRALSVNGRMMMIPVVDLMNHRSSGPGLCRMSHDALGQLIIVADQDMAAGQELCLCYGDKSLPELFACYGIKHGES